jgi:tetratricopeptide (TPR) repeat protein
LNLSLLKLLPLSLGLGLVGFSSPHVPKHTVRQADPPVDYAQVDLILRNNNCVDCHNASPNPASKLSLATYEGLMEGGRRGEAIEPGKSADSLMIRLVTHTGLPTMPPGGSGLKEKEIATLKAWIDEGAKNSDYGKAVSRYYDARHAKNWDDALKACDEIEAMKIDGIPTAQIAVTNRLPIYTVKKDEASWYEAAAKAVEAKPINVGVQNDLAWTIVDPQTWVKKRDLALAEKAALLAVEGSERKSGAVLDTLAWVYFQKGDKAKAIETEKEALKCRDAQGPTLDALNDSMKAFGG